MTTNADPEHFLADPGEWAHLVRALDGEIKARDAQVEALEARFEFEHELAESLQAEVERLDGKISDWERVPGSRARELRLTSDLMAAEQRLEEYEDVRRGLTRRIKDLVQAIRDIDAHATPLGGEEFVEGGYLISIGCLHRALALLGQIPTVHHTAHIPPEAPV